MMNKYKTIKFRYQYISPEFNPDHALSKAKLGCFNIETQYLIHVDVDELLILPDQFEDDILSYDSFYIPWVLLYNTDNPIPKKTGSYIGIFKHMARTALISGFKTPHDFEIHVPNESNQPIKRMQPKSCLSKNIYIAHHWARSFNDCIIKTTTQRFDKSLKNDDINKNSPSNSLSKFVHNKEIPKRLRYLAYLDNQTGNVDISQSNHQELYRLDLENLLITSIIHKTNSIKYKNCIRNTDHISTIFQIDCPNGPIKYALEKCAFNCPH